MKTASFLSILIPALSFGAEGGPPADVMDALKVPGAFQIRTATADIPLPVRTAFAKTTGQASFSMAEPGARWQSTDVMVMPPLPGRRLRASACSKVFCIIFYETGGVARMNRVAVFRLNPNDAKLVWNAIAFHDADDPKSLLIAIENGKLRQDPYL
ncbi:MAG TPA: hypothetical protein VGL53_13125 [Bryobacteraceae bacterium]|jgi:hypothetical protein